MPTFSFEQIDNLRQTAAGVTPRAEVLVSRLSRFQFRQSLAEEYAVHGLARRVNHLSHSICRVYEVLPPELSRLPSDFERLEATTHIHSIAFNIFGSLDNVAHIWVNEMNITGTDGKGLLPLRIGFGKKCSEVRSSLPSGIFEEIEDFDRWLNHLEVMRHSLAHRIPPYIPPYCVHPKNLEKHDASDRAANNALHLENWEEPRRLASQERDRLRFFRPVIVGSLQTLDSSMFHAQILADFATIEQLSNRILDHLESARKF